MRIGALARTLRALDEIGAINALRSVRDAVDRNLGAGRGLRSWCFDAGTDRDAGRFVAGRLGRQPFVDGPGGLFQTAEGARAIEAVARNGRSALGLGLAALEGHAAVALRSAVIPTGGRVPVSLTILDSEGERKEMPEALCLVESPEVEVNRAWLVEAIDRALTDGRTLLLRASEVFPRLLFGALASKQIQELSGTEPVFRQLLRHLRALDLGASTWKPEQPYEPSGGLSWSVESGATLADGKFGPMRDFPVPDGFDVARWSLHTKLTGGAGARVYFRAERRDGAAVVLVGYFGKHLPGVRDRT